MKYFLPDLDHYSTTRTSAVYNHFRQHFTCVDDYLQADVIVPIGGDGAMLRAIREHRDLGKPFLGIHAGTRGFLMNEIESVEQLPAFLNSEIEYHQLWLLEADLDAADGKETIYGFNDIWVERASGQSLRMHLTYKGSEQQGMLVGDGMLFCTPQGSTGYNLALRGKVILPGVPVLQITPIACVVNKAPLDSIILSDTTEVCLRFEQLEKRPVELLVDGVTIEVEKLTALTVRRSVKSVKLGFSKSAGYLQKMSAWQLRL